MKGSTVVLVIIAIFTFPIWIGIAGGLFGAFFGILAGAIGLVVGIFAGIIGIFASIIGAIFGWDNHWGDFHWHHFSPHPGQAVLLVIFVVALGLALRSRSRRSN
jgi:hypothetical protein